jgi:Fe-S cluster assembly ATPase SufC
MTSKTTKPIASRIAVDLYLQLQDEAQILGLNMKDYLMKIILDRNNKKTSTDDFTPTGKEKIATKNKQQKVKMNNIGNVNNEFEFPE